jgi:hypothetical protein
MLPGKQSRHQWCYSEDSASEKISVTAEPRAHGTVIGVDQCGGQDADEGDDVRSGNEWFVAHFNIPVPLKVTVVGAAVLAVVGRARSSPNWARTACRSLKVFFKFQP